MPDRDRYIPGVPCWADTSQPDPQAAADFYSRLFGWEIVDVMGADAPGTYLVGRIRGGDAGAVSSIPDGAPPAAMWNTYVWVESADDAAARAWEAHGTVITEPFDVGDAGRMAVIADTEGAVFCVWEAKQHRGAAIVNEHGSVNFNDLHTRDPEKAKAFYGTVFGWEVLELDGGGLVWTLPGYGDHLELDNPDLRKNMAAMGAPAGFEDVVATLVPIADDEPDIPHWGVTFAVDDADAAAQRAEELGATVIAPPADAPWVRLAVLRDPQGATFVASQFVPENKDMATAGSTAATAG